MTRTTQNNEKAAYLKTAFPEHSGGIFRGVQLRWVRVRGATRTRSLSITTPSLPPPMRLLDLLARSSSLMPGRTRPISSSPQPNGTRFSVKHILEDQPERRPNQTPPIAPVRLAATLAIENGPPAVGRPEAISLVISRSDQRRRRTATRPPRPRSASDAGAGMTVAKIRP